MSFRRNRRRIRDLVTTLPFGEPVTAQQHKRVALHQLVLAEMYPKLASKYLAAAQVHMLAAQLAQHEEAAARADVDRKDLADTSIQNLLAGMQDMLIPPRSAHVQIFHTIRVPDPLNVYTDADPLVEVYAYIVEVFPGTHDHSIANEAMGLFCNTAAMASPDERGDEYRWRGNRPLDEGDAVAIDGRFYRSTHTGWTRILSPKLVDNGGPGSKPLRSAPETP